MSFDCKAVRAHRSRVSRKAVLLCVSVVSLVRGRGVRERRGERGKRVYVGEGKRGVYLEALWSTAIFLRYSRV